MKNKITFLALIPLLILSSCQKSYVNYTKEDANKHAISVFNKSIKKLSFNNHLSISKSEIPFNSLLFSIKNDSSNTLTVKDTVSKTDYLFANNVLTVITEDNAFTTPIDKETFLTNYVGNVDH